MADYRVNLEIFAGPMDLLLYLVRKDEVDVYDIPIANITNQYLEYIEMLKSLDIDLAGDFLVMAATLMQIKSAMLLPMAEPEAMEEGDIEDPRAELIRQLLEYKKFKDAANLLSDAAETQKERHARPDSIIESLKPETEPELDIEQVSVWDLLEAFDSIIKATGGVRDISHIKDDTPIDLYQIQILGQLQDEGPMVFKRLFEGRDERIVMVGLFLALLELVREGLIWAEQEENTKEIYLKAITDEPAEEAVKKAVVSFREEEEKKPQIPIQEIETKGDLNKESVQKYEKVEPAEQQEN
ncbi:MAG: segregation and condensation protein A [Planctomycetota bacterium]|jgi:segregation and condensation protein A